MHKWLQPQEMSPTASPIRALRLSPALARAGNVIAALMQKASVKETLSKVDSWLEGHFCILFQNRSV